SFASTSAPVLRWTITADRILARASLTAPPLSFRRPRVLRAFLAFCARSRADTAGETMASVGEDLLRAYQDALYRVEDATECRVGEHCEALARLHAEHGATHSHFITAFNPESKRLSADANVARHAALAREIDALGARRMAAAGLDPDGQWPPE